MPPKRIRIASQACESCRIRKSKCDEERPRCGSCRMQDVICVYASSSASRLEDVEERVAALSDTMQQLTQNISVLLAANNTPQASSSSSNRTSEAGTSLSNRVAYSVPDPSLQTHTKDWAARSYNLTMSHYKAHMSGNWEQVLDGDVDTLSNLNMLSGDGPGHVTRHGVTEHVPPLLHRSGLAMPQPLFANKHRMTVSVNLSIDRMRELTDAYFRTFNTHLPLLDYAVFVETTFERISSGGCAMEEIDVVLALLVFALGGLALGESLKDPLDPLHRINPSHESEKANTSTGLQLFTQACSRLDTIGSLCLLERAQVCILQGSFYAARGYYMEYWTSITAASSNIKALIEAPHFDWTSQQGRIVSRAFWACLTQTDIYHIDPGLPQTAIHGLEDEVPLPSFLPSSTRDTSYLVPDDEQSYFKHHFLAMIALRKLLCRIKSALPQSSTTREAASDEHRAASDILIHEMRSQLDSWKSLLPQAMQWHDSTVLNHSNEASAIP